MSNTTPPPHASSSYAYNYGGRWQGISVEKVINAFLQYLEMDPEKNEVNYDTYGRFHACYESVADAVYGEKQDANARRNDTKWLDTLWKQNRRKIRTIVLRKALEQNRISREQLEKCRRKALERAAANYDFIDTLPNHQVDSKNRHRAARQRDSARNTSSTLPVSSSAMKHEGTARNGLDSEQPSSSSAHDTQHGGPNRGAQTANAQSQRDANTSPSTTGTMPNFCVPVPVDRCVKLAIFTSNSLKLGQLLAPFEMPNGTLLVLDNDEVFVFQKAHVNLNLQLALANGQSASTASSGPAPAPAPVSTSSTTGAGALRTESVQSLQQRAASSPNAATTHFESPPAATRTRNKRKSNAPRSAARSKRLYEPAEDSGVALDASAINNELNETIGEFNEPDTRSSTNYSNVTGSPIVSNEDEPVTSNMHSRMTMRARGTVPIVGGRSTSENGWLDEADVKPLIIAE